MDLARIRLASLASALLFPCAASAAEPADTARRVLDLSPERVAAFQAALRDLRGESALSGDLYFEARYSPLEGHGPAGASLPPAAADGHDIRVPWDRDLVFEESFMIGDREDDYVDAAKSWAARWIKGSDAADAARAAAASGGPDVHYGWEDGPRVGVKMGPMSARVGWNGDWRVRYARALRSHPGWMLRAWIESDEGEEIAAFTVGRSLHAARRTSARR